MRGCGIPLASAYISVIFGADDSQMEECAMERDDETAIPIITQPEDLFDDLREQTIVARLAEGLLCYSDPSFASAVPPDGLRTGAVIPMTD